MRQRRKIAIGVGVELNENQIPNLDAARIVLIHERTARVAIRRKIDVQFGTGTAWAGVAHHPEIILLVSVNDVDRGIEIGFAKQACPVIVRFLIELARLVRPGFVNGGVKALRRKTPAPNDQFPRPFDRFFFEIIAEAPVAEHFEKCVVIGVEADVFEIVVFATGANAFLRVGDARRIPRRFLLTEEDRHELVHAGIGEEQIRRVRQER